MNEFKKDQWIYLLNIGASYTSHSALIYRSELDRCPKTKTLYRIIDIQPNKDYPNISEIENIEGINYFYDLNYNSNFIRLATEEEIKQHLIKEAIKRGFVEGVEFNPINTSTCMISKFIYTVRKEYSYGMREDILGNNGNIYYKGSWAKIIKTDKMEKKIISYKLKDISTLSNNHLPEFLQSVARLGLIHSQISSSTEEGINTNMNVLPVQENFRKAGVLDLWFDPIYEEDTIRIGSYKVVFNSTGIKIGCQKISTNTLIELRYALQASSSTSMQIGHIEISLDVIKKILNKLA